MGSTVAEVVFWVSLGLLLYIYVGYPVLIALLARVWPYKAPRNGDEAQAPRRFSVVMACHNEAQHLPAKLDSLYRSTVAEQMDEVIIGSDGSTDRTAEILAAYSMSSLRVTLFEKRRGKAAVLNDLVPTCRSEILVFTDGRQAISADAIERMLTCFDDPAVGVVSGELKFLRADGEDASSMGAYWAYEKWIRNSESHFRGVPGASGALYAIRGNVFKPIPPDTILDDVLIPFHVICQGYRCRFVSGAYAFDRPSASALREGIRKRRTMAGNIQLFLRHPSLLNPQRNPLWVEFISHKALRLISPFLLTGVLLASLLLARGSAFYSWMFFLQALFYALAVTGLGLERRNKRFPMVGFPKLFLMLQISIAQAWRDYLRNEFTATWDRSDKED